MQDTILYDDGKVDQYRSWCETAGKGSFTSQKLKSFIFNVVVENRKF